MACGHVKFSGGLVSDHAGFLLSCGTFSIAMAGNSSRLLRGEILMHFRGIGSRICVNCGRAVTKDHVLGGGQLACESSS